jgi:hypothetical protein
MYNYHKTKESDIMLICEMEDSHLANTIRYFGRKLESMRRLADNGKISEYEKRLYNRQSISQTDLADITKEVANRLAPYALEASLRGLPITEDIRRIFMRTQKVERQTDVIHLLENEKNRVDTTLNEILHDLDEQYIWNDGEDTTNLLGG